MTTFLEDSGDSGDSQTVLTGRVLVMGNKLDETGLVGSKGLAGGSDDFKVGGKCTLRSEGANFPSRSLTNTNFGLTDAR